MALKLAKRNGVWHVEGRVMGQRVRQSTRLPDTAVYRGLAEKERVKIEQEIIEGKRGRVTHETFADAAKSYLDWKRIERKTSKDMFRHVDRFNTFWSDVKLTDITSGAVQTWVTHELTGLKPGSVRRYLNTFRAILNHARRNVEGFAGVEIQMPTVKDARDVHFDEGEANAFLAWVIEEYPMYYPHFVTLIDTGVRLNELLSLRSTNFSNDVLRVRRRLARTGKTVTRDIPLSEEMGRLAHVMRARKPTEALYVAKGGDPWRDSNSASATLNSVLKAGCGAIGLPSEGEEAMRVHDLRHTFAYLTAKAGADLGDLQYLLGHEDIGMTMRYRGFIQSRARTFVGRARRDADVSGQESGHV